MKKYLNFSLFIRQAAQLSAAACLEPFIASYLWIPLECELPGPLPCGK